LWGLLLIVEGLELAGIELEFDKILKIDVT
jgi:hypothetical protein